MKRTRWIPLVLMLLCLCQIQSATPQPQQPSLAVWSPPSDRDFSSTREIDRLDIVADGTLWASTSGGALRFQNGTWKKFKTLPAELANQAATPVKWRGQAVTTSFDGLLIDDGKTARRAPLPPSSGTHISALLPRGSILWAALFGDGVWAWNGTSWSRPNLHLPADAQEITALAQSPNGKTVWLGTRRQGVWQFANGVWKQHLQPDEPFAHNIQSLQTFRGALWASTLEDGLIVRNAKGWQHLGKGVLSSNAPRQMAVFAGKLYVRHSNEVVDQFDGTTWKRNVFPTLPRKQIISIAADQKRLYLGQWGGWSEWDGKTFSNRLRIPELQIVPLQHIVPDGNALWLGTENRGLFRWQRATQNLEHFDERHGLPDHWIVGIYRTARTIFAGTFGSGLAFKNDGAKTWQVVPELKGLGITSITRDTTGQTWIATRYGLYSRNTRGEVKAHNANLTTPQREIQALLPTSIGLWIGTRAGLFFRTRATLQQIQ